MSWNNEILSRNYKKIFWNNQFFGPVEVKIMTWHFIFKFWKGRLPSMHNSKNRVVCALVTRIEKHIAFKYTQQIKTSLWKSGLRSYGSFSVEWEEKIKNPLVMNRKWVAQISHLICPPLESGTAYTEIHYTIVCHS